MPDTDANIPNDKQDNTAPSPGETQTSYGANLEGGSPTISGQGIVLGGKDVRVTNVATQGGTYVGGDVTQSGGVLVAGGHVDKIEHTEKHYHYPQKTEPGEAPFMIPYSESRIFGRAAELAAL